MSNKQKIIIQYSSDINTLREISERLSSNRQTGNFYNIFKCVLRVTALYVFNFEDVMKEGVAVVDVLTRALQNNSIVTLEGNCFISSFVCK